VPISAASAAAQPRERPEYDLGAFMSCLRPDSLTGGYAARRRALKSPGVRAFTLASATGRLAIGVGLALAPRQALAALGFSDPAPSTIVVARLAGGRDLAMGLATLLARRDADRLGTASLTNAGVDLGDALTFSAALAAGDEEVRLASIMGIAAAVPSAATGAWVARRLGV
jgi:hypothetical protein